MSSRTFVSRARKLPVFSGSLLLVLGLLLGTQPASGRATESLPSRLSDRDYWQLIERFSEPNGFFQSDNLVSNERQFQNAVSGLQRFKRGGVYLGVAPDQNFTFILGLEPKIAFIVDIRRGNLHTQMMYKALIEGSTDRADFVSRLFARPRPAGLTEASSASDIFAAFDRVPSSDALAEDTMRAISTRLLRTHGFGLSDEDLRGIENIYHLFVMFGPDLTYSSSAAYNRGNSNGNGGRAGMAGGPRGMPSYAELQAAVDSEGRSRSYLGTEENFRALKTFEEKNLLVPVVGDFAGTKALRSVGQYLAEHNATVSVFYVSNVEQYLFQNGIAAQFYDNVSTLPLDDESAFLRSARGQDVLDPIRALLRDFKEGRIGTWQDVTRRGAHAPFPIYQ